MGSYTLRFARVVIMEVQIEAENEEEAEEEAFRREGGGELSTLSTEDEEINGVSHQRITLRPGVAVQDVVDYEEIWEISKNL